MKLKGIILAGGHNTRLWPAAQAVSKQLLPVYDKPMIYYPLATLMEAGIQDILIITRPGESKTFAYLLDHGERLGIHIGYAEQKTPKGLADAFRIASGVGFAGACDRLALILGDNIFHGNGLSEMLTHAAHDASRARVFLAEVSDPTKYGVAQFAATGNLVKIVEKPEQPPSNWAVTGLYFYDSLVLEIANDLKPSARGELEITDLNNRFINLGVMKPSWLRPGQTWLDAGTPVSLLEASQYVHTIQERQGILVGSPEEVAFRQGWLSREGLIELSGQMHGEYDRALQKLARQEKAVLS